MITFLVKMARGGGTIEAVADDTCDCSFADRGRGSDATTSGERDPEPWHPTYRVLSHFIAITCTLKGARASVEIEHRRLRALTVGETGFHGYVITVIAICLRPIQPIDLTESPGLTSNTKDPN